MITTAKKTGRPGQSEWAAETYLRLTPFLIVSMGLKRSDEIGADSSLLKKHLVRAVMFLKSHPDHPAAKLEVKRAIYFKHKAGWTDDRCRFSLWMTSDLAHAITAVARPVGEIGENGLPNSRCIKRLLTVAAALDGKAQDEHWKMPSYEKYVGGHR